MPSPPPDRAEFRAEVLQKKREERLAAEGSLEEQEEHRRLMAWNDEENARQRARRSAQPCGAWQPCPAASGCCSGTTELPTVCSGICREAWAGSLWAGLGAVHGGEWSHLRWGMVTSSHQWCPQGSGLGPVLFNILNIRMKGSSSPSADLQVTPSWV